MNKIVKNKKSNKLLHKKSFNKQELLMMKKWNRLLPYYRICGLTNDILIRAYSRVKLYIDKEKFQLAIKYIIEALKNNIIPKDHSIGMEYWLIAQESKMYKYLINRQ